MTRGPLSGPRAAPCFLKSEGERLRRTRPARWDRCVGSKQDSRTEGSRTARGRAPGRLGTRGARLPPGGPRQTHPDACRVVLSPLRPTPPPHRVISSKSVTIPLPWAWTVLQPNMEVLGGGIVPSTGRGAFLFQTN